MDNNVFNDFINEIIQKNDIVSVCSKYVSLERKGRYYWCRCPLHGEKTPSFCINDIDNYFYCFGCHEGGNVIKFVQKVESLDFMESVHLLASWANIEVPDNLSRNGDNIDYAKAKQRKDRLLNLMKDAARHYIDNLKKPNATQALEYMAKRQIDGRVATHFAIGFADGYNDLPEYLKKLGYTEEEMLTTGVVKQRDGKIYDPEANRLIFPIIDIYGNVIAFGGRTLEKNPEFAKYLNTAETELFNKRNTLYAINYLKKQRQKGPIPYVIVVEGYMDTISLHKAGFTMAVASMGTSLTQNQAKLIKRFVNKVFICYDGDSAGQSATLRGLDILKENGLDVMVVQLPDKYDPDDIIKARGREGYQEILDKSLPLVEFKLNYLKTKYDITSVDGRVKFLDEAINVLVQLTSVERELYTPLVSEISATNIDFIKREIDKKLEGKSIYEEMKSKLSTSTKPAKVEIDESDDGDANPVIVKAEKYILCAMIHQKPYAFFRTDVTYLFSGCRREIYRLICDIKNKHPDKNIIQELYNEYENSNQNKIVEIINYSAESAEDEQSEKKYYYDCLWKVYKNYLDSKKKELSDIYSAEVDNNKKAEIVKQIQEIALKLKNKKVDEL